MQTCLYTHGLPFYETHQLNNGTIAHSFENDAAEFITEQTHWMPSDAFCLDVMQQTGLNDTLEVNRQLRSTLQRKQDEIAALRKKNSQLRDLVRQAEHLANLLDTTAPPTGSAKQTAASSTLSYVSSCSPLEQHLAILNQHHSDITAADESEHTEVFSSVPLPPPTDQSTVGFSSVSVTGSTHRPTDPRTSGVKRCLWSSQDDLISNESASGHNSSIEEVGTFKGDAKRRKDDQELLQAQLQHYLQDIERDLQLEASAAVGQVVESEGQASDSVKFVGSFHGLKIVRTTLSNDTDSSQRGEAMCFKTSVREHSTIRTRVFPHGKSFTSPTPTGGYRFLWIPTEQ